MNIAELLVYDPKKVDLEEVFFSETNKQILQQLIKEHRYLDKLQEYGLSADHKILLHGHSGCGKTTTAKALAHALGKRLVLLNLSTLVSSKLGETARNMKAIFDKAIREKSVLFLDEFDQIGKMRSDENGDSASDEMRRLVNAILQLFDYLPPECLLVAATNHVELIDQALLRRFQLKLTYELPKEEELDLYYEKLLAPFPQKLKNIERRYHISYAEAKDYLHTAMKKKLIEELDKQQETPFI